ncbi:MAG: NADH-quinone oxidoreductase subunit L [Deltaproteobacteria bacterium]|nr:MAG: NADH-quinone oxidoreductase subunit L [Deltaproteobacteria bacterium]
MEKAEVFQYIRFIPLMPLIGVLINGVLGSRLPKRWVGLIACSTVGISFAISVVTFIKLISLPEASRVLIDPVYIWISSGLLFSQLSLLVDPLAVVMILVVSGVGFLIHIYSVGYMHEDRGYARYFTFLNLFTFAMLLLVLADNLLLMYVGWEGVGLCSYLLIGFWYEKKSAADAGKKAFIVTRIGDFGFMLGIFLLFWSLGEKDIWTIDIREIAGSSYLLSPEVVTVIALLLLMGAIGKSAQIPLYVWLPDAMEGPTPVSALIHAATMVTAGAYLIARMNFLYLLSPTAITVVAVIGVATAFYAATIGLVQNDIKRMLAYSTISQIGYMFLAAGIGAFAAGIFHLMTHAFFKALLFLGAGSVMHAMQGELDMRKMGGLRHYLPKTYWCFLTATLAISGVPLFSGFFSKDEILWGAFSNHHGHWALWLVGLITAGLTAFYMFRCLFMTFHGEFRGEEHIREHLHDPSRSMTVPLIILAILSVIGGYIGIPQILGGVNRIHSFLQPVFGGHTGGETHPIEWVEYLVMGFSIVAAFVGIAVAYYMYIRNVASSEKLAGVFWGIPYKVLLNKYYVDEIYNALIVQPIKHGSNYLLWKVMDVGVIDGIVNGVARLVEVFSRAFRRLQTGDVQSYAFSIILGAALIVGYLVFG